MSVSPHSKRGRKKLDPADAIRAQACWNWVNHRTSRNSKEIELWLTPASVRVLDSKMERPRKWDRYKSGAMCPADDGTESGTVGSVEKHLRGFRAFYAHPFWTAIRAQTLSLEQIATAIRRIPSINSLLSNPSVAGLDDIALIARLRKFDRPFEDAILESLSFDSMTIFLLMAHDPVLAASDELRTICIMGYEFHVPMLRAMPEIKRELADKITDLVDLRFEAILRWQQTDDASPLDTRLKFDEQLLPIKK